jgi:AraC-like DNA-binding protein
MRQLRSSDAAIAEIAQRVGYASEAAFSRAFVKHAGATPSTYRRRAGVRRPRATVPPETAAAASAAPEPTPPGRL